MDCAAVTEERAKLWDLLQDKLPLQICARLFNQADYDIYRDFFSGLVIDGGQITNYEFYLDTFLITVAQGILKIFNKVAPF